jgi:hypothetical protein
VINRGTASAHIAIAAIRQVTLYRRYTLEQLRCITDHSENIVLTNLEKELLFINSI